MDVLYNILDVKEKLVFDFKVILLLLDDIFVLLLIEIGDFLCLFLDFLISVK